MNVKILVTAASVLLAVTTGQAQSLIYSNAIVSLNPAGYWPMHEVEAPAQGDIETNYGSLGALANGYYPDYQVNSGAFIRQTFGPLANGADESVYFTQPVNNSGSSTNSLFVPHTSPLVTLKVPFTIEMWYMITNLPLAGFQGDILAECNGNKDQGVRIYFQNGGTNHAADGFNIFFYNTTTANQGFQININADVTNVWHYMVFTVDSSSNVTGYLDTVLANGNGNNPRAIPAGRNSPDSRDPLTIGNGLGNQRAFNGKIAEVAIYTNALSTAEISNHWTIATNASANSNQYFNAVTNDNPIIYFRMDSSPYTAPDSSTWPIVANYGQTNGIAVGNGVYTPGTMPGAVVGTDYNSFPGYPFGLTSTNVALLSGVSSFADVGNAVAYNPTGTTPFTVSAIFRGNPTDTNRVQSIIGHGTNSWELDVIQNGYIVFNSGTNDTAVVATGTGAGDLVTTTAGYDDGSWHQVVAVHNGTTNLLYMDGILNNTIVVGANNVGNTLDMMIGSDPSYTYNPIGWGSSIAKPLALGAQFAGQICDAAFFTNALTASQVQTLYNSSLIPPTIKQQPVSTAVGAGSSFTNIVVLAGGSAPLSYQWYTNGVPVNWATNLSLVFNPVQPGNAGTNYYLIVTNYVGAVTSTVVSLTVYSNVVFAGQFPVTYTNPITLYGGSSPTTTGSSPKFSVSVLGGVPISYQWWTNSVSVGGATGTSLSFMNVQMDSPTNVYCIVSNSYGTATSTVWSVSYVPAPTAPFPQAVLAAQPIGYWRLNEAPGPNNGNPGDAGIICNDYQSGNNGIYTNVYLGDPGFSPATDPTETSARFAYDAGSSCFAGMIGTNIDFSTPSGNSAKFTVAVWANGLSTAQANNSGLLTKGYFNGEEFNLDQGGLGTTLRLEVRDAGGGDHTATNTISLGSDSNWHFIVGVCDQVNSNILLYIDAQLVGHGTMLPGSGIINSGVVPLMIGARSSNAGTPGNNQFRGYLNDAAVYNYPLSAGQIVGQYSVVGGTVAPYFAPSPAASVGAAAGSTLSIPTIAAGTPPIGYVWTNVTTGGIVASGATNTASLNPTLNYNNVPLSWNGNQLKLVVTNAYGTANASVTLSVTNAINANPTNIMFAVAGGNQLTLSWPADHTGWRLQAQTNALSVGIRTNWVDVSGSTTTNQVVVPINPINGSVFYRLIYP